MKITLLGLRDLETDQPLLDQRDYGIMLVGALYSTEKLTDASQLKYRLKITHIEQIIDLKEHKEVKFEKGKSPSQKQRWRIEEKLGKEEYENFMGWLLGKMDSLTEEYIEQMEGQNEPRKT